VVLFNDIVVITVSKPTGKTSPRLPPSALPTDLCVKVLPAPPWFPFRLLSC
jgi:hypothetical protein